MASGEVIYNIMESAPESVDRPDNDSVRSFGYIGSKTISMPYLIDLVQYSRSSARNVVGAINASGADSMIL